VAEDRRAGDEEVRAGRMRRLDRLVVDPSVYLDEDVLGEGLPHPADPVDRVGHELLAAVARMDAHAEDHVGVHCHGGDILRLALGVEGDADIVLCMSIHPGYSGQQFMPDTLERVRALREALPAATIQVDGGIGPQNIRDVYDAGATLFIAGASIFGREDLPRAYRQLVHELA